MMALFPLGHDTGGGTNDACHDEHADKRLSATQDENDLVREQALERHLDVEQMSSVFRKLAKHRDVETTEELKRGRNGHPVSTQDCFNGDDPDSNNFFDKWTKPINVTASAMKIGTPRRSPTP